MFAYQEKTGMTPKQILELPYIQFVLGMLDAPNIDYDSKKKNYTKTAQQEIDAIVTGLG